MQSTDTNDLYTIKACNVVVTPCLSRGSSTLGSKQSLINLHIHKSITRARQAKLLYDAHLLDSTNSFANSFHFQDSATSAEVIVWLSVLGALPWKITSKRRLITGNLS